MYMNERARTVVVVVRSETSPRRSASIVRWLRCLLPAALLVVTDAPLALASGDDDVITLDADAIASGPLSVASAIEKALSRS
jgi:hypothetical protein